MTSRIIRQIHDAGRGIPGVRPETTAALKAIADVEARHGTAAALDAAISAVMTVTATLGARNPAIFEATASSLERRVAQLRDAAASLAAGRVPEGAVVAWSGAGREGRA